MKFKKCDECYYSNPRIMMGWDKCKQCTKKLWFIPSNFISLAIKEKENAELEVIREEIQARLEVLKERRERNRNELFKKNQL